MDFLKESLLKVFPKAIQELEDLNPVAFQKWLEFITLLNNFRDSVYKSWRDRPISERLNISILDLFDFLEFRNVNPSILDTMLRHYDVVLYCDTSESGKRKALYTNVLDKKNEGLTWYVKYLFAKCFPSKIPIINDYNDKSLGWDEANEVHISNFIMIGFTKYEYQMDFQAGKMFNEAPFSILGSGISYFEWFIGVFGVLVDIIDDSLWTSSEKEILYKIIAQNKPAFLPATIGYYSGGNLIIDKIIYGKDPRLWLNDGDSLPYSY